jgi:SAM-dependent methyltransferase
VTGSLAYRNHEAAILRGDVPEKYLRILPFIKGQRVLEIGSAEGVLALLLARQGKEVIAVEKNFERHEAAESLFQQWREGLNYRMNVKPRFVCGDIADSLDLLDGVQTVVAVRSIYYLGGQLNTIFSEVAKKVPTVVLCGNGNRAKRWRIGRPDEPLGDFNRYAASEGMAELLTRHGYRITQTVYEGDEIVVGER